MKHETQNTKRDSQVLGFRFQVSGFTSERGVSLYITFMVMTALLGVALGASTLLFSQIGVLRGIGHSVFAFGAVEAGLEQSLYIDNTICLALEPEDHTACLAAEFDALGATPPGSVELDNGASYQLQAESPGDPGCPLDLGYGYCVKSTGFYKDSRRAVRVAR